MARSLTGVMRTTPANKAEWDDDHRHLQADLKVNFPIALVLRAARKQLVYEHLRADVEELLLEGGYGRADTS
jgi:hypothetical protein